MKPTKARVVADLPDVPPGTSIRLERTAEGWVDRGALRIDNCDCGRTDDDRGHHFFCSWKSWVEAPSTETNETDRTEDQC